MSYTTNEELLALMAGRVLIELSADDPAADSPDWEVVARARAYADGQIDARLRQRYVLPLAAPPQELRDWGLCLARYWLYQRRPDGDLPAAVKAAADQALAALDAIRDGKMGLTSVTSVTTGRAWSQTEPRAMSRGGLAGIL